MMKSFSISKWIFILLLLPIGFSASAQSDGATLFTNNCASCHNKNMKSKSTGPALGGVQDRWEDQGLLYAWIRNSQAVIASGDPYATKLFAEYNKSVMTSFPQLTDEDIAALLAYIDEKANEVPAAVTPAPGASDGTETGGSTSKGQYYLLIIALVALALILARIISNLNYIQQVKDGTAPDKRPTLLQVLSNRTLVILAIFLAVVFGAYKTVNNAIDLGRQQGYAPTQPINFSHKIHAGIQGIDCQYCHDGARRSKHAVIPPVSTCMNCHKAIQGETESAKTEIGKIYTAAGYDPNTQTYSLEPKGIEWVRIHNLPDHVYFNHAQHVVAGGVECQTCHGEVEKMDVLQQASPLSMGWCVNCHRQTEVNFKGNDYYKTWDKYHADLKNGDMEKVTVEDIGGLECQKCHY
jgi:cytochrome c2